jgi:hypothetical protein
MNFLSQTNAAPSGQVEQKPEVEIRVSARTDYGQADRIDGDVKLASNNLDTLMPDVANINSRN